MKFLEAAAQAPAPVAQGAREGLGALTSAHRAQIEIGDKRRLAGSVALDETLKSDPSHATASRWDYGIGVRTTGKPEAVIWVEVHHASTGEVSTVLSKLTWLRRFITEHAEALGGLTRVRPDGASPFVWLATSAGTHIPPRSRQALQLRQAGLALPRRVLRID